MRYFKILFLAIFLLLTTFALGLTLLWFNLNWIIKPSTISYLQEKFVPAVNMEWEKIKIDVKSEGLADKTFFITSSDRFCATYKNSQFCFISFDFSVAIKPFDESLWEIERLKIEGQNTLVAIEDFSDPDLNKVPMNFQSLIDQIKNHVIRLAEVLPDNFSLDLPQVEILTAESKMKINAFFSPKTLRINFDQRGLSINGQLSFEDNIHNLSNYVGEFKVISDASDLNIKLVGDLKDNSVFSTQFAVEIKSQSQIAKFKSTQLLANFRINLEFKQNISLFSIYPANIKLKDLVQIKLIKACEIQMKLGGERSTEFQCPQISVSDFDKNKTASQLKSLGLIPLTLSFAAQGFVNEANLNQKQGDPIGSLSVQLNQIQQKELKLNAKVSADFLSNPESIQVVPTFVDIKLISESFSKLTRSLKGTALEVPAPLNTLDGRIELFLSDAQRMDNEVVIKGSGLARLSGEGQQTLDIDISNRFHYSLNQNIKKHFLVLDVTINKAYFYLPPFDPLDGMPAMTKDKRIQMKEREKKQVQRENKRSNKTPIEYKINVASKSNNSIRLFYKLFEPYLSMGLSAQLTPQEKSFQINTGSSFVIDYMKRQVEVQKINMSRASATPDQFPLDIRLRYEASGYEIFIDVIGHVDKPKVLLSSNPSVSRSDIISLLLYNRTSSDLNRFENENIGNMQSAITDRALGLFGIWAFASTPIDSVSYDSSSQVYRAQISLPQGIKFDIGTDWEKTSMIGLRKRITDHWLVTTGYETTQDEGQTGNMFLQREFTF